jgi:tetratricopeptide (TPR) repeat protein
MTRWAFWGTKPASGRTCNLNSVRLKPFLAISVLGSLLAALCASLVVVLYWSDRPDLLAESAFRGFNDRQAITSASELGFRAQRAGRFAEAETLMIKGLQAAPQNSVAAGTILFHLAANAFSARQPLKSHLYCSQAMGILQRFSTSADAALVEAAANLCDLYWNYEDGLAASEDNLKDSVSICQQLTGTRSARYATACTKLGMYYLYKTEQYTRAVDFLQRALSLREDLADPHSYKTLCLRANVGLAYLYSLDDSKAVHTLSDCLATGRLKKEENAPASISCLLACGYIIAGQERRGRALFQQGLTMHNGTTVRIDDLDFGLGQRLEALARALECRKRWKDSLIVLDHAIAVDSKFPIGNEARLNAYKQHRISIAGKI